MVFLNIIKIVCFPLLIIIATWQLYFAVQLQLISTENTNLIKSSNVRNARILTYQAKQKHLFEADLAGAQTLLQNALKINSYYVPAWLSLVELHNDWGEKNQAGKVFKYTDELTQEINRWRWDKALVAYQTGIVDILPGELSHIINKIPGKDRNDALQLAFTLWKDPEIILQNVGIQNLIHLLNHSVRQKLSYQALYFWRKIEVTGVQWNESDALNLINMLLHVGEVSSAREIWRTNFNTDHLFYNGNFNKKIMQRAFGWRKSKDKSFVMRLLADKRTDSHNVAEFRFKGWDNINFNHFAQIVPLEGGKKYKLTADVKSKSLTTDQRPFIEVYGYKCEVSRQMSEMVDTDQDWSTIQVDFGVPQNCSAMVVRLRRVESRHLDNKLSGKLWLRDFSISETGEGYTILDDAQ